MSIRPIQELNVESMSLNLKLNRLNSSKQNQIKVNRKKLPSDFFSRNSQRSDRSSSKQRSKEGNEQMRSTKRHFNSERKINTSKNLNQFQNYHEASIKREMTAFNNERVMAKVFKLKLDKDHAENEKRKVWRKSQLKTFRFQKKVGDLDLLEEGLSNNEFCSFNFKSKQYSNMINKDITKQNPQILDMNCTFGKKFNKCPSFSLQNTIDLKQSKEIEEEIQRDVKIDISHYQRKQKEEISTQESSQIFQVSKMKRINHTSQRCTLERKQEKSGKNNQKRHKIRRNSLVEKAINLPRILDSQDRLIQL